MAKPVHQLDLSEHVSSVAAELVHLQRHHLVWRSMSYLQQFKCKVYSCNRKYIIYNMWTQLKRLHKLQGFFCFCGYSVTLNCYKKPWGLRNNNRKIEVKMRSAIADQLWTVGSEWQNQCLYCSLCGFEFSSLSDSWSITAHGWLNPAAVQLRWKQTLPTDHCIMTLKAFRPTHLNEHHY